MRKVMPFVNAGLTNMFLDLVKKKKQRKNNKRKK